MKTNKIRNFEPQNKKVEGIDLTIVYNEYFAEFTKSDAISFLTEYLETNDRKSDLKALKKAEDGSISSTAGWVARLLTNGCSLPDHAINYLDDHLSSLKESYEYELSLERNRKEDC